MPVGIGDARAVVLYEAVHGAAPALGAKLHLAVMVFTAHGSAENATEAMKLGATDFAEKPFSPPQIRALVKEIRGGSGVQDEGTEALDGTASKAPPARPYTTLVLLYLLHQRDPRRNTDSRPLRRPGHSRIAGTVALVRAPAQPPRRS